MNQNQPRLIRLSFEMYLLVSVIGIIVVNKTNMIATEINNLTWAREYN